MTTKEQIDNDVNSILAVTVDFLKRTSKTDLQSQIDFMEYMNNKFIITPLFIAAIQSLKELQSIKRNNNKI